MCVPMESQGITSSRFVHGERISQERFASHSSAAHNLNALTDVHSTH